MLTGELSASLACDAWLYEACATALCCKSSTILLQGFGQRGFVVLCPAEDENRAVMTILNEEQLPTQFEGFIDLRLPLALNHANVLNVSKVRDIFIHGAQISNFGALVGNEMLLKNVHKLYPICEQGQK